MAPLIKLSAADRARLVKLLSLLGSDHAGERDAAGLAAHRLIRNAGLAWPEVIKDASPAFRAARWRDLVATCIRHPTKLTDWETKFLRNLSSFQRPSHLQLETLQMIAVKVGATEMAA